ncbi:MAG: PKD domain-containing protein [Propylenella sp.]
MGKAHRAAGLLLLAAMSLHARATSCVWYVDDDYIRRVSTETNQIVATAPLRNAHRLVMNADDCGVWTLDKHDRRLLRLDAHGSLERVIHLGRLDPRLDEAEHLQVDPSDGALWISDDRWIFRISSTGELLARFSAPGEVRRLQAALDRTLWVLGKRDLWHFDSQGALLARYALSRHLAADARFFAVDSIGGVIWIVDEDDLARLQMSEPDAPPLRIHVRRQISAFALDPLSGNVWVTHGDELLAFSRTGEQMHEIDLERRNLRKPHKLAFDPVARSLWLGSERSVSRFTDAGQFVVRFAARDGNEALGVPAFKVKPTLTLVRPPKDALTNNPQPELRLGYGAACNGQACSFPPEYFNAYQLSATLNSQELGGAFQFDPSSREVHHTPPARLPEGPNTFIAHTKDAFGNESDAISNTFTVDTVAPRFVTLSPADGSAFQAPQAIVHGTVDDAQASVILNGSVQTGGAFSFSVTLAPGSNTLALSAIDKAGNSAGVILRLTFVPVSVTIESPASGAVIAGDTVLVTGTFQGPPNTGITVNGTLAATDGNRFYAQAPLRPGSNPISVTATSSDLAAATESITVTSSGPSSVQVSVSRQQGIAPMQVSFGVSLASGTVTRIEADYDGNGTTDAVSTDPKVLLQHTYATPGAYQARFSVTDNQGNVHSSAQVIVAASLAATDTKLRAVYSGAMAKLRGGDIEGALAGFTANVSERYRAVFTALGPRLPSVVDQLGTIQDGTISDTFAEYALIRNTPAGPQAFLIYLVRGEDGVWRIDEM